ncbi:MAG: hypothetical protein H0W83_07235 [Planctomycetes bacterium]|nr:hypothetical protein [Planctomycetota bacterium]
MANRLVFTEKQRVAIEAFHPPAPPVGSVAVTHVFAPQKCGKACETAAARRGETRGILFDWSSP